VDRIVSASIVAPWGPIRLAATSRGLATLDQLVSHDALLERLGRRFGEPPVALGDAPPASVAAAHLRAALDALAAFLDGDLDALGRIAIDLGGRAAWDRLVLGAVRGIPPGSTASYGEVARMIGRPGAARAVGPQVVAHADWLVKQLESSRIALVDARPDAEFTGADGGMGGMHPAGHLAGARQLVWTDLVSRSSQFLPDTDLRAKLQAAGARAGVPVVSYCMIGMRASVIYFVARHLGYDAVMYDGSIVDWGHRKLPVRSGRP
jgi:O6-methylguanine-DNA--protein-cysteine methyltransferase